MIINIYIIKTNNLNNRNFNYYLVIFYKVK
uniref:Uncharacterized protein n=1 Tax=viral metagenome TaxID=1070528 RepID=A0A6C0H8L1_9ZZZZ